MQVFRNIVQIVPKNVFGEEKIKRIYQRFPMNINDTIFYGSAIYLLNNAQMIKLLLIKILKLSQVTAVRAGIIKVHYK